jgi:hypothetical protein
LNKEEPSSKAKYGIMRNSKKSREEIYKIVILQAALMKKIIKAYLLHNGSAS